MDSFTRRAHAMNENIRRSSAKKSTGTVEDQHTKWRYQKRSQQAPRCRDDFGVQVPTLIATQQGHSCLCAPATSARAFSFR